MAVPDNSTAAPAAAPVSDKMERIEKYRAKIRDLLGVDFPVDGGFATARVYYQGIEITVGQRAGSMYDALAALSYGLTLAQYELGVSVKAPDAPVPASPGASPSLSGGASTTSTPAVGGPVKGPAAGPVVSSGPVVKAGAAQPVGNGNGQPSTGTMPVESIRLGQGGDHPYWVVRGGKWKKHGVIVWPEVLEAWGVQGLDPMSENQIEPGWVAVFEVKSNGNPDKVLRFEAAGQ